MSGHRKFRELNREAFPEQVAQARRRRLEEAVAQVPLDADEEQPAGATAEATTVSEKPAAGC